jgi:1,4-dihydroxy-2-naphthoate octaprenyltransferase
VFFGTTDNWLTLKALLFCIFVQLGTNLHNDYSDFVKGADTKDRVGQARATQQGWLSPAQTAAAACGCLTAAAVIPLTLPRQLIQDDVLIWFLTVTSIFNAFAYTGGPFPLGYIGLGHVSIGYSGLGDVFVFLYFGLVATLTLPYILARLGGGGAVDGTLMEVSLRLDLLRQGPLMACCVLALPVGFLAINIIVVNNLRDRHTDVLAHKRTLAVRCGATFCRIEYTVLLAASYAMCTALAWSPRLAYYGTLLQYRPQESQPWMLLPLLSLPMAWVQLEGVWNKEGSSLNAHVGGSALLQLLFCVLMVIGLTQSSLSRLLD